MDIRGEKTRMSNQVFINIYNIIINKDMTISVFFSSIPHLS